MALLNPDPALTLPTSMWLTFQTVANLGPLTQSDLFGLISPTAIRRDAATQDRDASAPARAAVRTLRDFDLIALDPQDRHTTTVSGPKPVTYGAFCALLRTTLLSSPPTDPPLDEAGANDLLRALAWLLTTNPVEAPWMEARAAQQKLPNGSTLVFVNSTRWNGFRYWAEALGFAEPALFGAEAAATLVANPTRALRDLVTATYRPGDDVPISRVMQDLRAAIPVLPGGAVSRALGFGHDTRQVDCATGYALDSGQLRGWLSLQRRADAADTMQFAALDDSGQPRVVSHVVIGQVDDV
jgi:hypothetical protein